MSDEKDDFNELDEDGVVVDIGPDSQHINSHDVNERLKADDNGFRPTPQQESFRTLAYRMAERKRFFRGEWYKATKSKEYMTIRLSAIIKELRMRGYNIQTTMLLNKKTGSKHGVYHMVTED